MKLHYQQGSAAVWGVGLLAVIALIIAWTAFNRSGQNVAPTVAEEGAEIANEAEQASEELIGETEVALARAEARADLLALEARIEAEEGLAEVAMEVNEIERALAQTYANASVDVQQEYAEIEASFQELENNLRAGTGDALETLAGLALLLEDEARSDPESPASATQ